MQQKLSDALRAAAVSADFQAELYEDRLKRGGGAAGVGRPGEAGGGGGEGGRKEGQGGEVHVACCPASPFGAVS